LQIAGGDMSGVHPPKGAPLRQPERTDNTPPASSGNEVTNQKNFTGKFTYSSPSIDMGTFQPEMLQDKKFYETYFFDSESGDFGGEVGAKNLLPGLGGLGRKLANVWSSVGTPSFGATFSAFNVESAKLALEHVNALVEVFGGLEATMDQVMSYIQGFTNGGKGFDYDHAEIAKLLPVIDAYLAKADPASSDYESVKKLKELLTSGKEELSKEDAMNMQIYLTTFKEIMVPNEVSTKALSNLVVDAGRTYQDLLANQRTASESWASKFVHV
jgi:hypothetical protein